MVLSFPCPGFRWAVPAVWLSRRLIFSWNLSLGSSLSLPVFADDLGWLGLILGYPPSVAWLWRLLPWFFVRYLSACPCGAAVPLDSLVLWCSWSSCSVTCLRSGLCSSSVRDCDVAFPPLGGFAFDLSAGSPASSCRCGLRLALVRAAVQPSHGSVLLLWPGFLFSGPGWWGRLPPCSFSSVFLRDVVTLWGQ